MDAEPLLKTLRGVCLHLQRLARAPDARRAEIGRLKEDRCRFVGHLAFGASNYTGDAHGIMSVGDYQHLRRKLPVSAVEKTKPFAGPCSPHHDAPLLQSCVIEGV